MTEEQNIQTDEGVATDSQNETNADVGELIAESKKYRNRAQKAESDLAKLNKRLEQDKEKQLEEQKQWEKLANERKATIDELTPVVDRYKADEAKYRDELLSDFSDDDREDFKELPIKQLRSVHTKLIQKTKIPNVDNSPPGETAGYTNAAEAAKAYSRGEIDQNAWQKIRSAFANKAHR